MILTKVKTHPFVIAWCHSILLSHCYLNYLEVKLFSIGSRPNALAMTFDTLLIKLNSDPILITAYVAHKHNIC